jgi:hypothetical protein
MKQYVFMALAVAMTMTACNSNDDMPEDDATGTVANITFNVQGDFTLTTSPTTRALTADGKDMTDVWVFDYVGNELKQQVHQTGEDEDFGQPTMTLSLGTHHLYFVASRGIGVTLNTDARTLTFSKVRDTFWKDYAITITEGTSSGSRAVALDRVVTNLKLIFSDAIPTGAATFNVTPATWYYGFNYQTGEPTAAANRQITTVNIPSSEIGVVNETVSIFGFSSATEWTTDVAVDCKTSDSGVLGFATISAAPFVRNRVSEYTGPLFTAGGGMTLSLNTEWDESYQGSW